MTTRHAAVPVVLGVDGGQSGIRVRCSVASAIVEETGVSHADGDAVGLLARAVRNAYIRGDYPRIDRVVLGITTIPATSTDRRQLAAEIAEVTGASEVWLADDTVTAHAGAFPGGWGVSLVAGTGVACLAVGRDRRAAVALDGHGYLVGDDGGGFWVGRHALNAVFRAGDGRGPETALTERAAERFDGLVDLDIRLHTMTRPVNSIAQFAVDVLDACEDGDAIADRIMRNAAEELAATMRRGIEIIERAREPVPVALAGKLLQSGTVLRRRLEKKLDDFGSRLAIRNAASTGLDGAIRLGVDGETLPYADLIEVIHTTTKEPPL